MQCGGMVSNADALRKYLIFKICFLLSDSDNSNELVRKRRAAVERQFNFYTQTITESQSQHLIAERSIGTDSKYENIKGNRTIYFNCENGNMDKHSCIQAKLKVNHLIMGNEPILIVIKFGLDLNVLSKFRGTFVIKATFSQFRLSFLQKI